MMNVLKSNPISMILQRAINEGNRICSAWENLDDKMPEVNKAFKKVRDELLDVGLLAEDTYLDQIELKVAVLPSYGEAGYFWEKTGFLPRLAGYKEGVIYLPSDIPKEAYVPGGTLVDTIRHEFGHAWHWIEPEFFEREWFRQAFNSEYNDPQPISRLLWEDRMDHNRIFRNSIQNARTERAQNATIRKYLLKDFVSEYAATKSCEDFAETFMMYLRYRKSLSRFKSRPGVYKKIRAVEKAVRVARKELGL